MMNKKIVSVLFMSICGILFSTALPSAENSQTKEKTAIGLRAEPLEMRMAQLEKRAKTVQTQAQDKSETALKRAVPSLARGIYATSHPGAFQNPISVSGCSVELMDGSIWAVNLSDTITISYWSSSDLICITPNHSWFSSYAFRLTNQHTGDSIETSLKMGPIAPIFNSSYTHWIAAIDYYYNIIYLEDGSIWNMSSFDNSIIDQWIVGDVVIIGVNDGWFSSYSPNILINVAMLNFAAGSASL